MSARTRIAVVSVVLCIGCGTVRDAAQQVVQAGGAWKTTESVDKLTGESVVTARETALNDEKSLSGELALECRSRSKQLQLSLSSFDTAGRGIALEDSVAVRVRDQAPTSAIELFGLGLTGQNGELLRLSMAADSSAAARFGKTASLPSPDDAVTAPATNVLRLRLDAVLKNAKAISENAELAAANPPTLDELTKRRDSLRVERAKRGDSDTTFLHVRQAFDSVQRLVARASAPGRDSLQPIFQGLSMEYDLNDMIARLERDPNPGPNTTAVARKEQLAKLIRAYFGDLAAYRTGADLLRGLGPELAFQYYNKGRANTLTLRVSDVSRVLDACR